MNGNQKMNKKKAVEYLKNRKKVSSPEKHRENMEKLSEEDKKKIKDVLNSGSTQGSR